MPTKEEWQGMYWDLMILAQKGLNPETPALCPRDFIMLIVYVVSQLIHNHHVK